MTCNAIYFDEACFLDIIVVLKFYFLDMVYSKLLSKRHQIPVKQKILHTAKKVTHFKRKNADYCPPKKWEFHIGPSLGKENDSTLHFTVSRHAKHQFAVFRAFPLGKGSNKLLTSPACKIGKIFLVVSDCLQAPFSGVQLCCSLCFPPATLWLPKNLLCWKRSKDP